jgi:hypothetical protein
MPLEHFRALARRQVRLSGMLASSDGSWERAVRITNLGLGGARVALLEQLPVGTAVRLSIVAPHLWEPLVLSAEVAWARAEIEAGEAEVGLEFEEAEGSTLRQLTELLETHQY